MPYLNRLITGAMNWAYLFSLQTAPLIIDLSVHNELEGATMVPDVLKNDELCDGDFLLSVRTPPQFGSAVVDEDANAIVYEPVDFVNDSVLWTIL